MERLFQYTLTLTHESPFSNLHLIAIAVSAATMFTVISIYTLIRHGGRFLNSLHLSFYNLTDPTEKLKHLVSLSLYTWGLP